jgi:hypothetical protein
LKEKSQKAGVALKAKTQHASEAIKDKGGKAVNNLKEESQQASGMLKEKTHQASQNIKLKTMYASEVFVEKSKHLAAQHLKGKKLQLTHSDSCNGERLQSTNFDSDLEKNLVSPSPDRMSELIGAEEGVVSVNRLPEISFPETESGRRSRSQCRNEKLEKVFQKSTELLRRRTRSAGSHYK